MHYCAMKNSAFSNENVFWSLFFSPLEEAIPKMEKMICGLTQWQTKTGLKTDVIYIYAQMHYFIHVCFCFLSECDYFLHISCVCMPYI